MLIITQDGNTAVNTDHVTEIVYSKNESLSEIFVKQGDTKVPLGTYDSEWGLLELMGLVAAMGNKENTVHRMNTFSRPTA